MTTDEQIKLLEDRIDDLKNQLDEKDELAFHLYENLLGPLQERAKEILADMYLDIDGARTFTEVRQLLEDLCEK
jgi:hypothetical protein